MKLKWYHHLLILALLAASLPIQSRPSSVITEHGIVLTVTPRTDDARIKELEQELSMAKDKLVYYASLEMVIPASQGHGEVIKPPEQVTPKPDETWFQAPRKVRFSSLGDYVADEWLISIIETEQADGSHSYVTNEQGVTFRVKEATKRSSQYQAKWSAAYLYGTDGSHEVLVGRDIWGWLNVKAGSEIKGDLLTGKVGLGVQW